LVKRGRMRVGIVGAGMAGLACAEGLARQGHAVVLLDKGRGPGGRMSTRRIQTAHGEAQFDHGAQYFTVHDQGFREQTEAWIAEGVVASWPAAGTGAYVGVPAMNSPVRRLAQSHTVHWSTLVTKVENVGTGWRLSVESGEGLDVDMAIIAAPAEQAAALLATAAPEFASRAAAATSQPCWTVTSSGGPRETALSRDAPGLRAGSYRRRQIGPGCISRPPRTLSPPL
jgi:renalase